MNYILLHEIKTHNILGMSDFARLVMVIFVMVLLNLRIGMAIDEMNSVGNGIIVLDLRACTVYVSINLARNSMVWSLTCSY